MIVFGIHCNFLIVLLICLRTFRSVASFLQGKMCAAENRPRNLSRLVQALIGHCKADSKAVRHFFFFFFFGWAELKKPIHALA